MTEFTKDQIDGLVRFLNSIPEGGIAADSQPSENPAIMTAYGAGLFVATPSQLPCDKCRGSGVAPPLLKVSKAGRLFMQVAAQKESK